MAPVCRLRRLAHQQMLDLHDTVISALLIWIEVAISCHPDATVCFCFYSRVSMLPFTVLFHGSRPVVAGQTPGIRRASIPRIVGRLIEKGNHRISSSDLCDRTPVAPIFQSRRNTRVFGSYQLGSKQPRICA